LAWGEEVEEDDSAQTLLTITQSFSHGRTRIVEVDRTSSQRETQSGRAITSLTEEKEKKEESPS
jgi:hypothetical protein